MCNHQGRLAASNHMRMPSITLQRERERLHCSLPNYLKKGDRISRPPDRYSDDKYPPSKRNAKKKRRNENLQQATKRFNGQTSEASNHYAAPMGVNYGNQASGSSMTDFPFSSFPLEFVQNTTNPRQHGNEAEDGRENIDVLIRNRRETRELPADSQNVLNNDPLWSSYMQQNNNPGVADTVNSALLNSYAQQMNALLQNSGLPQNIPPFFNPYMNWNSIAGYNVAAPPQEECPECMKEKLAQMAQCIFEGLLQAMSNKMRAPSSQQHFQLQYLLIRIKRRSHGYTLPSQTYIA
ncbi:unnamed protein product [Cylicocyclus nassatus]|uniref:Uncharacterized protein n=1 Tax=Cylicocyclus nassatus TaxID=53992 RepID=A0AA36DTM8_CYLNA|nr:unnamed protein product [Cylicocyclus nassatus]